MDSETCRTQEEEGRKCQRNSSEPDIGILEVRNSLSHASDSSNDVAMGDHDTLGDACGAAGVHDDGDVRGLWLSAVNCHCRDRGAMVRQEMDHTHQ